MPADVFGDDWDAEQDQPGFRWKRLRLARRLGAELLGASVYELPPGERSFPYHFHHANEELLLVLEGSATIRTPAGEEQVDRGGAMLWRRGPEGAHQVINRSDALVRFLVVSTMIEPEVAEYVDTGKLGIFTGGPPGSPDGEVRMLRTENTVDYFEGEPPE